MSDRELNRIQLIDPVSEDALIVFGDTGAGQGQFKQGRWTRPYTWRGDILVADSENARLQSLSQCTPSCSEEFNCGSNGCGGLAECVLEMPSASMGVVWMPLMVGPDAPVEQHRGATGANVKPVFAIWTHSVAKPLSITIAWGPAFWNVGGGCPDPGIAPELEPTMVYQATIGESDGNTFIQPTELFIDGSNRVWVIDSVSTKIKAFQLTP